MYVRLDGWIDKKKLQQQQQQHFFDDLSSIKKQKKKKNHHHIYESEINVFILRQQYPECFAVVSSYSSSSNSSL